MRFREWPIAFSSRRTRFWVVSGFVLADHPEGTSFVDTSAFKRLNRTRAERRARLHVFAKTRVRLSTSVCRYKSDRRTGKRSPSRVVLSLKVRLSLQVCRCEFSAAFHGRPNERVLLYQRTSS